MTLVLTNVSDVGFCAGHIVDCNVNPMGRGVPGFHIEVFNGSGKPSSYVRGVSPSGGAVGPGHEMGSRPWVWMEALGDEDLDGINEEGGIVSAKVRERSSVVGVKGVVGRGSSANHA